jgi:hypothetical protein
LSVLQVKDARRRWVHEVAEVLGVDHKGKTQEQLWTEVVQRLKVRDAKGQREKQQD